LHCCVCFRESLVESPPYLFQTGENIRRIAKTSGLCAHPGSSVSWSWIALRRINPSGSLPRVGEASSLGEECEVERIAVMRTGDQNY
jgi:hypothetical protein